MQMSKYIVYVYDKAIWSSLLSLMVGCIPPSHPRYGAWCLVMVVVATAWPHTLASCHDSSPDQDQVH